MVPRPRVWKAAARAALATTLLSACAAAPAWADGTAVWKDCARGGVDQPHSQADYIEAIENPPAEALEYSDCLEQINRAYSRYLRDRQGSPAGPDTENPTIITPRAAVPSSDLASALGKQGLTAAGGTSAAGSPASASGDEPAAPPVTVDGKQLDLAAGAVPTLGSASSLPLPLGLSIAALALVAAGPAFRRIAALRAGRSSSSGSDH